MQAVKRGCYNCCVLLVSHYGADVNIQAKDRCSPLHYAAHHGHEAIAKFLVRQHTKASPAFGADQIWRYVALCVAHLWHAPRSLELAQIRHL